MNKKTFVTAVRQWDAASVRSALRIHPEIAKYSDAIGKTPLHHCAEMNAYERIERLADCLKTAKALIAAGADVNAIRVIIDDSKEFHATPLWYAIAWGKNSKLAQLLLENGAHPDDNAVSAAIWDQDRITAKLLIAHGGNINATLFSQTALLRIVRARRFKLLPWLVETGADINFQDPAGYSALHHACSGAHTLSEIELLLKLGADAACRANDGRTPIKIAEERKKKGLLELLLKHQRSA